MSSSEHEEEVANADAVAPDNPTDFQSQSRLIMAVDFGTTFTGVAFYYAERDLRDDPHRIAQRINVIRTWPNPVRSYMEKTPTVISYGSNPHTWGGGVRPTDENVKRMFKLGLEPRVAEHYRGSTQPQNRSLFRRRQRPPEPVDIATDYLTCIYKHVHNVTLSRQLGNNFLQNQRKQYVITVPAIWSDQAKALTRQAATRAGFPDDQLSMITEPEAAALYCAAVHDEFDLVPGDRFTVCDAGGGTVVSVHL